LSDFQFVELDLTAPQIYWLTSCFRLNPEVYTVGVHALSTKSTLNISLYLRSVDGTSNWVNWLNGREKRGTRPIP
jgi:hypothetical protein